ncbi:MAG: sigma-70 family RNA polymerase sigma factor [Planctomycetes bacterium]|nr:sigma-70 family RNA polymerase sigma factor [Planctomycetota bacterium]
MKFSKTEYYISKVTDLRKATIFIMEQHWQTQYTIIRRATLQTDERAWDDFFKCYQGYVSTIIHKQQPRRPDHEDIVQTVLVKIFKNLSKFEPGGPAKFRTWLYTLIRNAFIDYLRVHDKNKTVDVCDSEGNLPQSLIPQTEPEIEKIAEDEWRAHISNLALKAAEEHFSGKAVMVFKMSAEGVDVDTIANDLGINKRTVYTLKNRVKTFLIKQINELCHDLEL